MTVLVSLLHYNRPKNIPRIIKYLRLQTVPVHIALVECSDIHPLSEEVLDTADSVWKVRGNPCPFAARMIPPLAMPEYEHVYFCYDDLVPGIHAIEFLLETGKRMGGDFASIGQYGRVVKNGAVENSEPKKQMLPQPVDFTLGSHLMRTKFLLSAVKFRNSLLERFGAEVSPWQHDMLANFGVQLGMRAAGFKGASYLTACPKIDTWLVSFRLLHSPVSLRYRPGYQEDRNQFLKLAMECGWKSSICEAWTR